MELYNTTRRHVAEFQDSLSKQNRNSIHHAKETPASVADTNETEALYKILPNCLVQEVEVIWNRSITNETGDYLIQISFEVDSFKLTN